MGYKMAWLDYKKESFDKDFIDILVINKNIKADKIISSAIDELQLFAKNALDKTIEVVFTDNAPTNNFTSNNYLYIEYDKSNSILSEGYKISVDNNINISAKDNNGILFAVFRVISLFRTNKLISGFVEIQNPSNPLRMLNHWDNMTGDIERGYSGNSFFFDNNEIIVDKRIKDYARLIASIGINGIVINNVNVKDEATLLITNKHRKKICEIATIFSEYGIKLFLSINFAAPIEIGGLSTADPLQKDVIDWWANISKELFESIPDFGGFLVKADSEGRPGPFTYNRNHADGANMLAKAVKPYNGLIIWRCFVYNCQQDWRDKKTDRAKAGYDNFKPLDGKFDENVILQIKNGPMDFQIREPVSPLLGAMENTNQILEFQIAQEYTGHQIDVCYLIPLFKEVLDFKTYCKDSNDKISDIISGKTYANKSVGIAAVTNTGNDYNWTGNDLATANLYGFGMLAFNNSLSAEHIAEEWIRITYGNNKKVVENILKILISSRDTYEKYTVPLGIGWMVKPHLHYGPSIDGYEYDRWGTYHRADINGIGVDRTTEGTGYTGQYFKENFEMFNDVNKCPEELLLFFHHVSYKHILKSGKTLIQHIYDTHFDGVDEVNNFINLWNELKPFVSENQFENVSDRFNRQLKNAIEWRDVVCSYFFRKSGINDDKQRKIY